MQPQSPQPLNYHTPQRRPMRTGVIVAIFLGAVAAGLLMVIGGWFLSATKTGPATVAQPPPSVTGGTASGGSPIGFADDLMKPGDQQLLAAQMAAIQLLDGLIERRFDADPDLAPLSKKLREYNNWNVYKQSIGEEYCTFTGYFHSINGWADFSLTMVKQKDGTWKMETISGPTRQK